MDRATHERGFTLSELLTTIAVAGISLSLVIPGFDSVVSNNRRATAVNQFVSTMHAARSEAITRNQQITICPSSDALTCGGASWENGWLYFADLDRDQALDAGEGVIGASPTAPRITITTAEFPVLSYRPTGRVLSTVPGVSTGEFTFCDHRGAEYARVVIVNPMGEPRLSETTAAGAAPACGEG